MLRVNLEELLRRVEEGDLTSIALLARAYETLSHALDCPYRQGGECLCLRNRIAMVLMDNSWEV